MKCNLSLATRYKPSPPNQAMEARPNGNDVKHDVAMCKIIVDGEENDYHGVPESRNTRRS